MTKNGFPRLKVKKILNHVEPKVRVLRPLQFEQAMRKHNSDYSAKGFASWGQFVVMLFC